MMLKGVTLCAVWLGVLGQVTSQNHIASHWECDPIWGTAISCTHALLNNTNNTINFEHDSLPLDVSIYCPNSSQIENDEARVFSEATHPQGHCRFSCSVKQALCLHCQVLETESGFVVNYDCHNIVPQATCPSKFDNECQDYVYWNCIPLGQGYSCSVQSHISNPAFQIHDPTDSVLSRLVVYCENDITGRNDLMSCQNPLCEIWSPDGSQECLSCNFEDGGLIYDCARAFPSLLCPILHRNGTCSTTAKRPLVESIPIALTSSSSTSSSWTWTLDMDPTTFNVLSDVWGFLARVVIGWTLVALFSLIVTVHLKRRGTIAIRRWTGAPGDVVQGAMLASALHWSLPGIVLAVLLLTADLSHSIADVGLDFVTISEKGPLQAIMVLATSKRNKNRPINLAGDPPTLRNTPKTQNILNGQMQTGQQQVNLMDAYMAAVLQVLTGESPFLSNPRTPLGLELGADTSLAGIPGFKSFYRPDNGPLAEMNVELALECPNTEMVEIHQVTKGLLFDKAVESIALLPNCSFLGPRASGIFGGGAMNAAQIVEQAVFIRGRVPGKDGEVMLRGSNNELFYVFELGPSSRRLARDRPDWTQGRVISEIQGVQIGNQSISFVTTVLASGTKSISKVGLSSNVPGADYGLVAQIVRDDCPDRPSQLPSSNTVCMAFLTLSCDDFPEDSAWTINDVYYPLPESNTTCILDRLGLVWGRNFDADALLVTVVAGLYGTSPPNRRDYSTNAFDRYSILSAMFALGTLEEKPSARQVVRPQINILYLFFVLLPIFLSMTIVAVVYWTKKYRLPTPSSPWEWMILGREEEVFVPKRQTKGSSFPHMQVELYYAFFEAVEEEQEHEEKVAGIVSR